MPYISFYIYRTERTSRTKILTGTASYTQLLVYNRYFQGIRTGVSIHQGNGACRTMAFAVITLDPVPVYHTTIFNPDSHANGNSRFIGRRNRFNRTGRTYSRTFRAFGTAVSSFVRHLGLHERHQFTRRAQDTVRTSRYAKLAGCAMILHVFCA